MLDVATLRVNNFLVRLKLKDEGDDFEHFQNPTKKDQRRGPQRRGSL